jgi:hypothetical protein
MSTTRGEGTGTGSGDDANALTALDWIGAFIVAGGVMFCVSFPWSIGAPFRAMFGQLGAPPSGLPGLVLSSWFAPVLGLVPAAMLSLGLLPRQPIGRRRALIVAAFVVAVLCAVLCLAGVYLPVFQLAGKIEGG